MLLDSYFDRVRQGDGDSKRKSLRHSNDQHSNANDEELDKELDIDWGALFSPGKPLDDKSVHQKQYYQDDYCAG